jgi:hypothetical protein
VQKPQETRGIDPLLLTARAQAPSAAGERDEELVAALRAADAGEAFPQVAAGEEPFDGPLDDGPPEAVALLEALRIGALELLELPVEQLPQRRVLRVARAIDHREKAAPGTPRVSIHAYL